MNAIRWIRKRLWVAALTLVAALVIGYFASSVFQDVQEANTGRLCVITVAEENKFLLASMANQLKRPDGTPLFVIPDAVRVPTLAELEDLQDDFDKACERFRRAKKVGGSRER